MRRLLTVAVVPAVITLAACGGSKSASTTSAAPSTPSTSGPNSFIAPLTTVTSVASTVPANGDVNPYGLVSVPTTVGRLHAGEFLISNFNAKDNDQGTGTTIEEISTTGKRSQFAHIAAKALPGSCPGGVGLTTALSVLPDGYVVVGSLPTTNGQSATAKAGCLIVLDSSGRAISTIAGPEIAGPWDMTAASQGDHSTLFVSNALNGGAAARIKTIDNSTVVRISLTSSAGQPPKVTGETVIADRIPWRDDKAALVIGPTGVALASNGTLYVADTLDSRIAAIPQAMTRTTAASDAGATVAIGGHLNQPLGLVLAPNGDILTTNAGDGNIVETTPTGMQLTAQPADPKTGAGSLFGLAVAANGKGVYFVDDGDNTLRLLN
jgi:sugar lactone lactonase YvrE